LLFEFGWTVTCIDKDPSKIEHLRQGGVPIYEPRLDELLHRNCAWGASHFVGSRTLGRRCRPRVSRGRHADAAG
jgi:UDP-glucose 6-dehydrogenase